MRRPPASWRWRRVRLPTASVLLELAAVALALGLFLVLGREYAAPPLVALDEAGRASARGLRSAPLDAVVNAVTGLGSEALWFVWAPVAVALLLLRRLPSAAALVVVSLGVQSWNDVLKAIYQRARPTDLEGVVGAQTFSFPSGHAMAAGAVYAVLAFIAWRELRGQVRWAIVGVCLGVALCVALTRVYLGVHYPTDVLAGLLAGMLWADFVVLAWRVAAAWTSAASALNTTRRSGGSCNEHHRRSTSTCRNGRRTGGTHLYRGQRG
jgi:undecaprenyl-diphosphatase